MMDILDRLLGHDAWTTRQLLVRCGELSEEEWSREFDIGHRSVKRTLGHIVDNMEIWTDLMSGKPQRPSEGAAVRAVAGLIRRLDVVAAELAELAMRINRQGRMDEMWVDYLDKPPTRKTYGGAIAHVITHSMHHRAQVLYMLRLLGMKNLTEGDVLSWEGQHLRTGG